MRTGKHALAMRVSARSLRNSGPKRRFVISRSRLPGHPAVGGRRVAFGALRAAPVRPPARARHHAGLDEAEPVEQPAHLFVPPPHHRPRPPPPTPHPATPPPPPLP